MGETLGNYAGDIGVLDTWTRLGSDAGAQLIDVRTHAEWSFVGVADLRPIGKAPAFIEWQSYPSMSVNDDFVVQLDKELARRGVDKSAPLFFLCRSGARSQSAAMAAAMAGYTSAYNIEGGFEGPLGPDGHRGSSAGWKAAGLPWIQS